MEQLLLRLASTVAARLATSWLLERGKTVRRGMPLAELIAHRFPALRQQRQFKRKLEEIEDQIVERLTPLCDIEFAGLEDNERSAALLEVIESITQADLSDRVLLDSDLEPRKLATIVHRQMSEVERHAGLSEPGEAFYQLVLTQACYCLSYLVLELPEFHARAAAETLARLSTLAAQIELVLDRLPAARPENVMAADQDDEFRGNYLKRVVEAYDRLDLLGITTIYYEPRMTLSVAYLSLSASIETAPERGTRRIDEFSQFDQSGTTKRLQRVEEALGTRWRVVIQGDAGAGKTTLLQWLAITAARQRFTGAMAGWNGLVPFLVKLRDFAGSRLPVGDQILTHANALSWGHVPDGWVHRTATANGALFMVDGVDELVEAERQKVREWIQDLVRTYPRARVVLTSRPSAVGNKWLAHERFDTVMLDRMTPDDVRVFVSRWHQALLDATHGRDELLPCKREDVAGHERSLLANLESRSHLSSLARSPLLCAMIAALNLDRQANLPRDRMALYDAALEMLLERRDADYGVPAAREQQLSLSEKRSLLRSLAWWLNENGRAEMSVEEALHQVRRQIDMMPNVLLPPYEVLKFLSVRSGVIRQPALGRIDFVHRTFQEFLAAREAVDRNSIDLLINVAHSDLWRETLLMACAHASPQQRGWLLRGILNRAYDPSESDLRRQLILLCVACLEMAVEVPADVIHAVDVAAREVIPPQDLGEVSVLATLGSQLLTRLPDTLNGLTDNSARAVIRSVALSTQNDALELLRRYAGDPRSDVQFELIDCWRYFDPARYADIVLGDAPLLQGHIDVQDVAWLPHLRRLRKLVSAHVQIYPDRLDDLSVLYGLRGLTRLLARVNGRCSISPLHASLSLEYLNLTADGFADMHDLLLLQSLRELVLKSSEPVTDLSFAAELTELRRLEVDRVGDSADLSPVLEHPSVRSLGLRNCAAPVDVAALAKLPALNRLDLRGYAHPLDVSAFEDRPIQLMLNRDQPVTGLERLSSKAQIQIF